MSIPRPPYLTVEQRSWIGLHLSYLHLAKPDWWMQYIGGPDACVGCGVTDVEFAQGHGHKNLCRVAMILAHLDPDAPEQPA